MGGDRHLGKGSLLVPLFASRLAPDAALILSDVALEAESSRSWPALCHVSPPRTSPGQPGIRSDVLQPALHRASAAGLPFSPSRLMSHHRDVSHSHHTSRCETSVPVAARGPMRQDLIRFCGVVIRLATTVWLTSPHPTTTVDCSPTSLWRLDDIPRSLSANLLPPHAWFSSERA